MDNRQQPYYVPGPPPPPNVQRPYLPPPPPRGQIGLTAPALGYYQSQYPPGQYPPGTVVGIPGGWQQSWGRPGMSTVGPSIPPPPPPVLQAQHHQYNAYNSIRGQPSQLPPPPSRAGEGAPLTSATFVPSGGNVFGPGVGIEGLGWEQYENFSGNDGTYDPAAYADKSAAENSSSYNVATSASSTRTDQSSGDTGQDPYVTRDSRAGSAASHRPRFPMLRENPEPASPGPQTATLINANATGRPRAQSNMAASPQNLELANQWPTEKVLLWMAANGFSTEWQKTFELLKLEKNDFLDIGRGGDKRTNLSRMHQTIYPTLAQVCKDSGSDYNREREDGRKLRRLISQILHNAEGVPSTGTGHRRRESGLNSAASEDHVENSPRLGTVATPSTTGPEGSPARAQFPSTFPARSQQERSTTMPAVTKHSSSNSSTSVDTRNMDGFVSPNVLRGDYSRSALSGLGNRDRHSPNMTGDQANGARQPNSPRASPALAHTVPAQAQSNQHLPLKSQTVDSFQRATGFPRSSGPGNIVSTELPITGGAGRFYENRTREDSEPSERAEARRSYSNEGSQIGKEHKKNWISSFLGHKRKHDQNGTVFEDAESPTSPAFQHSTPNLPYARSPANGNEPALSQRPASAAKPFEHEKNVPEAGFVTSRSPRPRRYIMVTPDSWNYRLIDVTDTDGAKALRQKIAVELGYKDRDAPYAQISITEPGRTEHSEVLTDAMLAAARNNADSMGTLKFYVKSLTSSAGSTRSEGTSELFQKPIHGSLRNPPVPADEQQRKRASDQYRRETEEKQRQSFETRQSRRGKVSENGTPIIDFDSPSDLPRPEEIKPHRKPPSAPAASQTLAKVNSRRTRPGSSDRTSFDASKRISGILPEEFEQSPRKRLSGRVEPAQGIGAAIANSSKIAMLPTTTNGSHKSPRTITIGNGNDQPTTAELVRRPEVLDGPSFGQGGGRPGILSTKSYGSEANFKETNVQFAASPKLQTEHAKDEDSDDSDEGLFQVGLRGRGTPVKKSNDAKPSLTLVTDQVYGRKSVNFQTPSTSDERSAGFAGGDGTEDNTSSADLRSFSDRSGGGWDADSPNMTHKDRPDSFHSEIWADRPDIGNVVQNLDQFFPGVDLDKPYLEDANDGSPMQQGDKTTAENASNNITFGTKGLPLEFSKKRSDSDTLASDESTLKANKINQSIAQRNISRAGGGLGRMKSIREVAQKRNDLQRGPSVTWRAPAVAPQNIVRRKSTKMFGANIVQITGARRGANRLSTLDPIPQEDIPSPSAQPTRQDTFRIIRGRLIGKGTYGKVYLGMNATTGDFLAVKQVEISAHHKSQADKDKIKDLVKALELEIDTMKDLDHKNIVQYLGFKREEFSISIYLEYIDGGSVGSCLRKHGKFEEPVVRSLTRQTLEGLEYLHRNSILHRDLKADNLLLDLNGICKISDFGVSKKSDDVYNNDVTNSMQGSVFWMAPEVIQNHSAGYSAKVDIWSLGCVVLEMFAGKRPWSKEEAVGAMFKLAVQKQAPPISEEVSRDAGIDGLNFMYDCFQIDPDDRPTAKALLQLSSFCVETPGYRFYDTLLASKLGGGEENQVLV